MTLKIAIIGAGPAGCMLARLIQQSKEDISVTVFEGEGGQDFRSQGGTLDLHEKTGQAALKAGNLFNQFQKWARYDGEALNLCDKKLLSYIKMSGGKKESKSGRPEIDRPKLREILYNGLAEGTVKWNHKLIGVGDDLSLRFGNDSVEKGFDLVVGADGAWSKVRPRVSEQTPYFSGIGGYYFHIPDAEKNTPELYTLVNRGSMFSWSDGRAIFAQYMGDGSVYVTTCSVRDVNWQKECRHDVHDATAVKEACRKEYADWDPRLVAFTQEADDNVIPRDLYMLPIGHKWQHVRGVTLIGDASHLMTPFAGEGVNLALEDSLKLSAAIISAAKEPQRQQEQLDTNVAAFEQDMFKRATETQQMTYDMMYTMFMIPGAPRSTIEKYILRAIEGELGWAMTTFIMTPIVYTYFFFFKLLY